MNWIYTSNTVLTSGILHLFSKKKNVIIFIDRDIALILFDKQITQIPKYKKSLFMPSLDLSVLHKNSLKNMQHDTNDLFCAHRFLLLWRHLLVFEKSLQLPIDENMLNNNLKKKTHNFSRLWEHQLQRNISSTITIIE